MQPEFFDPTNTMNTMTKRNTMTPPLKLRETRSGAPRAKRGTKAAGLTAARNIGLKTFIWKCPHHGEALHGTAGSGQCRLCVAQFKKSHTLRKAQIAREEAALTTEERETIAKAEAFIAEILGDGGAA